MFTILGLLFMLFITEYLVIHTDIFTNFFKPWLVIYQMKEEDFINIMKVFIFDKKWTVTIL